MYSVQLKSIFSSFCNLIANNASVKKPVADIMRTLTDAELMTVAGGPECEVGAGT